MVVDDTKPIYSLRGQRNFLSLARSGEPIPVIYGHHRIYPDFGTDDYHATATRLPEGRIICGNEQAPLADTQQ